MDGDNKKVKQGESQNSDVANDKKRKLAKSVDSSSSILEESRSKKRKRESKSKPNESLQEDGGEGEGNNDEQHGEDQNAIVDGNARKKEFAGSMASSSPVLESSKNKKKTKKAKLKANETLHGNADEKVRTCSHKELQCSGVDDRDKEKELATSLVSGSQLCETLLSNKKNKKAKSKKDQLLISDSNEKILGKNDGDGRHGECENFNADDIEKKKELDRSEYLSSSTGEASSSKKKKTKSKSNVHDKSHGNRKDKIAKKNDDDSRPSRVREEENLTITKACQSKKAKKVSFSGHDEVFPIPNNLRHSTNNCKLVVGKRYTEEENQILKDAINNYLKGRGLGGDDWPRLFCIRENPDLRDCWKEINAAIPWRTRGSIYVRAENLLFKSKSQQKGKWTEEEIELIKRYRADHGKGSKWKSLSEHLGRHRHHIKDAWRRNRLLNEKKGHWSQEEYQQLFHLVNMDLRMKAFENKDVRNLMVRDNISWTAISDAMATRSHPYCCSKWYNQLASPMVAQGLWADCDDYHLVNALSKLDASCVEDVDWDNLVVDRSGDVCRTRWKEMTKHIGGNRERPFMEQVELLSTRYCEDMLEYRTGGVKHL